MNDMNYELPIGAVLDSGIRKYRITGVLGHGGFGITYKAVGQVKVGNIVVTVTFAIKEHFISQFNSRQGALVTIPNSSNANEVKDSMTAFLSEARRLNSLSLQHPGIVQVNESFEANGTAYYVMEFVEGESLRHMVEHRKDKRLSEDEAVGIISRVGESLAYLHSNRLTHLDVKPDNILIRNNGQPVLIDFGLAKHYDNQGKATSTMKVGGVSDGYSPLEQYAGISTFHPEADVYALAATLLFMLTGKDPVKAAAIKASTVHSDLEGKAGDVVTSAIVHAMKILSEERTPSIASFLSELGENLPEGPKDDGSGIGTKILDSKSVILEKNLLTIGYALLGLALVIVALVFFLKQSSKGEDERHDIAVLSSDLDSLSYAVGMLHTNGLKEYLDSAMQVDLARTEVFKEGLLYGTGLKEQSQLFDDTEQSAFDAGKQIASRINDGIAGINRDVFDEDSTKSISKTIYMAGFLDGLDNHFDRMTLESAEGVYTRTKDRIRASKYEKNKIAGEAFLEANKEKADVHVLPSGVQYKVIKEGTGEIPSEKSTVTIHYEGRFLDGTVFDSSYEKEPVAFNCDEVIAGFEDALVHMPVGSTWEVYIPQEQAYGVRGVHNIEPYSMLIFKIELISVDNK